MIVTDLRKMLREVPDFPRPGILFYDVTTLFRSADAFHYAMDRMVERYRGEKFDAVAGIEARGFVLATAMADRLGTGLVLMRKPGKLPARCVREEYALEYGTNTIEVHQDAIDHGQRILIADDVLATGGTAAAAGRLVRGLGGQVEGFAFLVELGFLKGRALLGQDNVFSLIHVDG